MTDYLPCSRCHGTGLVAMTEVEAADRQANREAMELERKIQKGLALARMAEEQMAAKEAERQRDLEMLAADSLRRR
jgi:hypothetical protein